MTNREGILPVLDLEQRSGGQGTPGELGRHREGKAALGGLQTKPEETVYQHLFLIISDNLYTGN